MEKEKSHWGAQLFFNDKKGKKLTQNENVNAEEPYFIGQMIQYIYVPILYTHLAIIMHGSNDVIYMFLFCIHI